MKKFLPVCLFLVALVITVYSVMHNAHDFSEQECGVCHVDTENSPEILTGSLTKLCRKCHPSGITKSSHPVDIRPVGISIPLDLPLDKGKITCNTCHNVHAKQFNAFREKTYFLRRPGRGRTFCMSCHEITINADGHVDSFTTVHMRNVLIMVKPNRAIDPISVSCISCHDGSIGKQVDYIYRSGSGIWTHNKGSHPVGSNYNECRMRRGNLRPKSKISKKIKFFNGKVGCCSCHNPYSSKPGRLVMSNKGSRLCFQCHVL